METLRMPRHLSEAPGHPLHFFIKSTFPIQLQLLRASSISCRVLYLFRMGPNFLRL